MTWLYAIAIGSNRRGRHGAPAAEVRAAATLLQPIAIAPLLSSAPLGPSLRRYANTVVLVESAEEPPALLARLQAIERRFGRRRGQRWGARVIDLDVTLWSGGAWASRGLAIPHPAFRQRRFVLDPLVQLVPDWRDPIVGLTVRQLARRLRASRPMVDPQGSRA